MADGLAENHSRPLTPYLLLLLAQLNMLVETLDSTSLTPIHSLSAVVAGTAEHADGDAGQDAVALHQVHQAQQHQDPQRLRLAGGGTVCACACGPV